jgi:hypothetical protein
MLPSTCDGTLRNYAQLTRWIVDPSFTYFGGRSENQTARRYRMACAADYEVGAVCSPPMASDKWRRKWWTATRKSS